MPKRKIKEKKSLNNENGKANCNSVSLHKAVNSSDSLIVAKSSSKTCYIVFLYFTSFWLLTSNLSRLFDSQSYGKDGSESLFSSIEEALFWKIGWCLFFSLTVGLISYRAAMWFQSAVCLTVLSSLFLSFFLDMSTFLNVIFIKIFVVSNPWLICISSLVKEFKKYDLCSIFIIFNSFSFIFPVLCSSSNLINYFQAFLLNHVPEHFYYLITENFQFLLMFLLFLCGVCSFALGNSYSYSSTSSVCTKEDEFDGDSGFNILEYIIVVVLTLMPEFMASFIFTCHLGSFLEIRWILVGIHTLSPVLLIRFCCDMKTKAFYILFFVLLLVSILVLVVPFKADEQAVVIANTFIFPVCFVIRLISFTLFAQNGSRKTGGLIFFLASLSSVRYIFRYWVNLRCRKLDKAILPLAKFNSNYTISSLSTKDEVYFNFGIVVLFVFMSLVILVLSSLFLMLKLKNK